MEPIVTVKSQTAQLRYELPHRIHDAKVYPVQAPNGSAIVLHGNESGVGILWRGGRPLKQSPLPAKQPTKPAKVNGTSNSSAVMIIDSDDDEPPPPPKATPQSIPQAEFEDEEEELDPSQPYPSIVQHVHLPLNTEVLHIAIPQIPAITPLRPADTVPAIFSDRIVFAVACADCTVRIVTLPLSPPPSLTKDIPAKNTSQYDEEVLKIPAHAGHQTIPSGVTMTWTSRAEPRLDAQSDDEMELDLTENAGATPGRRKPRRDRRRSRSRPRGNEDGWDLLVASHSTEVGGLLKIFRFALEADAVKPTAPINAYQTLTLRKAATRIAFSPAMYPRAYHSRLLIADRAGIARVYDPFAAPNRRQRPGAELEHGRYVGIFKTPFENIQSNVPLPPTLSSRKPIIDAAWAADGQAIFALLADGAWGVWDMDRAGPKPPTDPSTFSIRGFISGSEAGRSDTAPSSPRKSKNRSSLVPMTPNTRRTREENLFQGSSSSSPAPNSGRVSIATLRNSNAQSQQESVPIWYGSETYKIPNLAQLWGRIAGGEAAARSTLSKVQGLSLLGERITSIDQFDTTLKETRMAIPRDTLVTTDHRLIILTKEAAPLETSDAVTSEEQVQEQETRIVDRALLARGELDLGGMDRMLEDMEGSGSMPRSLALGNPRKVLFASSTS